MGAKIFLFNSYFSSTHEAEMFYGVKYDIIYKIYTTKNDIAIKEYKCL